MPTMALTIKTVDGGFVYPTDGVGANVEVDTGYDGSILIPDRTYYDSLKLHLFETPTIGEIETPLGETKALFSARARVVIPRLGTELETLIETFGGCRELLAGREFLNRYRLILNGPQNKLCM